MTLSTLVTDVNNPCLKRMRTYALVGVILTAFCLVFTLIYEHFSHGAYSVHMRCMFLFPLLGCDLVGQICNRTNLWKYVGRLSFNLWNASLGTFCAGLLFRGIVNISGRFTTMDKVYYVLGGILALSAVVSCILENMVKRSGSHDPI